MNSPPRIPRHGNISAVYSPLRKTAFSRPVITTRVPAGFPSPAEDYAEGRLDLNNLIKHQTATFYVKVEGDSMIGENIHDGDILVVDRAEEPRPGKVVVVRIGNEHCVKKLVVREGRVFFCSANPAYQPIEVTEETDWEIWGVVMYSLHRH